MGPRRGFSLLVCQVSLQFPEQSGHVHEKPRALPVSLFSPLWYVLGNKLYTESLLFNQLIDFEIGSSKVAQAAFELAILLS